MTSAEVSESGMQKIKIMDGLYTCFDKCQLGQDLEKMEYVDTCINMRRMSIRRGHLGEHIFYYQAHQSDIYHSNSHSILLYF